MADIIKSVSEIEDIFREVACLIFDIDSEQNHKRIRFPWGSQIDATGKPTSAPDWGREEDVCFIYALPTDDMYNRQRNRRYIHRGGRNLVLVDEHTDVHEMLFVNYGPNAYDFARKIRNGLFLDDVRRLLRQNNFALVTDIPAPRRIPELVNAEWWNRVDVSARFNEHVRVEGSVSTIAQIPILTSFQNRSGTVTDEKIITRNRKPKSRKER